MVQFCGDLSVPSTRISQDGIPQAFAGLQVGSASTKRMAACSQVNDSKSVRVQKEETIEQFNREDFSGIRMQLPLVLRAILPESVLRKAWKTIRLFAGPIVSIGTPTVSEGWFTNTASMPIQFKRMKMTMAIQITKSGTVVGLRFLPSSLAALGCKGSKSLWQRPT
jgi:hypothetical protein